MELDVRTLILVLFLTLLLGQAFLLYLYRLGYPVPGMRYFLAGGAAFLAGLFLAGAREVIPDFLSIVVANVCLVLGHALHWSGIRRFLDRRSLLWAGALAGLLTLGGMAYLLSQGAGLAARACLVRLIIALEMGAISCELLAGRERKYGRPQRLIGWFYLINTLLFGVFAVQPLMSGEAGEFLSGTGTTGLLLLLQVVYLFVWTMGLIMMLGERFLLEVRAAKESAESASRAKSEFLANMSHEMRTPLAGLTGLLHLLESNGLDPCQKKYVESALHSAENLTSLIDDLLDMGRIEAGGERIESLPCSPRTLFAEAVRPLEVLARRKGLDFSLDAAGAPGPLLGDPKRLRQVAINLVGNAVKFTPAGRVAVTVSGGEAGADRETLRLVVEDTGIGIPADAIDAIFEKFTQVHADPSFGGAGLGLAICRRLARAMGGDITVESQPGKGSRFVFQVALPRSTDAAVAALAEPSGALSGLEPLARLSPLRILLAEDFEPIRFALSQLLARTGHQTACVENGQEAVEALLGADFDVILMDVRMPVMDGVEATQCIRALADPGKARVPIVAMTAHAFAEERARFLDAGMDDHIAKPANPADLARVLSRFAVPRPRAAHGQGDGLIDWTVALAYAGGNRDDLRSYCGHIVRLLPGEIEVMAKALRENNLSLVATKAHSLKPLAAGLGAGGLAARLLQAEGAGNTGDSEVLAGLFPRLQADLQALLREVGVFVHEEAPSCAVSARATPC